MNAYSQRLTARADRNDANEMVSLEGMRRAGLNPVARLKINMSAEDLAPLGALDWNKRADMVSAAPDQE